MKLEILNATIEETSDFPKKVMFRPAYSGGVIFAAGVAIPEPAVDANGNVYQKGTKLPVVVDLSTAILDQNIPIFYNHDPTCRIGHTESVRTDGKTLQIDGILESNNRWNQEIVQASATGAKWQASIGSGMIDVNQKRLVNYGETVTVNGQTLSGPFTLLSNLRVREISVVSAGADPNTETLLASIQFCNNTMKFEEFLKSKGFDASTLTEANRNALEALYNETSAAPEVVKASAETEPEEKKEEAKEENKKEETVEANTPEESPAAATEEKKEPEEVKAECNTEKKESVQASIKTFGRSLNTPASSASYGKRTNADAAPTHTDILQASCLLNLGIPAEWLEKNGYTKRTLDIAETQKRDTSLLSLMGDRLQASGVTVDYRNPRAIVEGYRDILQASNVSTRTFGDINVFSPIIDKQMRYKYEQVDSIWKMLLKKRTVRDFKKVATVDFDVLGRAKDLLENEDYPNVELKSSGAEFDVSKQGVIAAISFESQINDDMGALDSISEALVNMIIDIQIDKFWSLFWSKNSTIFTTGKGNKITKKLSVDGLTAARLAFGSIKNANGRFVHVAPQSLLVPQALADKAEELFKWQWAGENNTRANIHMGRYNVYTDPYLGAEGGYTGATDTGWFMLGDTGRYPIGEYGVLSGFETPGIKETWYDHKDALNMRALGTIGFHLYEENIPMVYSTGTVA